MIKKWALKKSFSTQNVAQQIKTMIRNRKIWMKIVENQKIRMCNYQATCYSSQDRKYSNHSNKNKQNWSCNVFEQDINVWDRIFCLLMWLNERDHSACNRALFSFCWDKISNSRLIHRSIEHQKSHQQFRESAQTDKMIHSVSNSVTV